MAQLGPEAEPENQQPPYEEPLEEKASTVSEEEQLRVDSIEQVSAERQRRGASEVTVDQDTCIICMEELEGGSVARSNGCKHKFHYVCLYKWSLEKKQCPICMKEFDEIIGRPPQCWGCMKCVWLTAKVSWMAWIAMTLVAFLCVAWLTFALHMNRFGPTSSFKNIVFKWLFWNNILSTLLCVALGTREIIDKYPRAAAGLGDAAYGVMLFLKFLAVILGMLILAQSIPVTRDDHSVIHYALFVEWNHDLFLALVVIVAFSVQFMAFIFCVCFLIYCIYLICGQMGDTITFIDDPPPPQAAPQDVNAPPGNGQGMLPRDRQGALEARG